MKPGTWGTLFESRCRCDPWHLHPSNPDSDLCLKGFDAAHPPQAEQQTPPVGMHSSKGEFTMPWGSWHR